jgi:hypothetical protein
MNQARLTEHRFAISLGGVVSSGNTEFGLCPSFRVPAASGCSGACSCPDANRFVEHAPLRGAKPQGTELGSRLSISGLSRRLGEQRCSSLALQLLFLRASESMGNHDSKVVDADSVD